VTEAAVPRVRKDRYIYGAVLIAAVGLAVLLEYQLTPGAPSTLVVGVLAVACAYETAGLLRSAGMEPLSKVTIPIAVALVLVHTVSHLQQSFDSAVALPLARNFGTAELCLFAFGIYCCACVLRGVTADAAQVLGAGAIIFLVTGSLLYIVDIRFLGGRPFPSGLGLVIFLVSVSKIGDIAAYIVGSAVGRHKMIPSVSPGKTWAGAAASFLAACGLAAILGVIGFAGSLTAERAIIGGIVVNVASQFGDLTESLLKRAAGAKDSGHLIPQFGGFFDLVDSLFLAAPMFYGFLRVTNA
jgi:phosphatidate cytidylyltransferase